MAGEGRGVTLIVLAVLLAIAAPLYARGQSADNLEKEAWQLERLGRDFSEQGRYAEAEPLLRRALANYEKAFGSDHPSVAIRVESLAAFYDAQNRFAEAEPLYKRALAIVEKTYGTNHPYVGHSLNSLALMYYAQGRYSEAEPLFRRALTIAEMAPGRDRIDKIDGASREEVLAVARYLKDVAISLIYLADLYHIQGRFAEAEPLYKRALAIAEKFGPDDTQVNAGTILNNLAALSFVQKDWRHAVDYWQLSTSEFVRQEGRTNVYFWSARRGPKAFGPGHSTEAGEHERSLKGKSEAERTQATRTQLTHRFFGLLKAAYRLASEEHSAGFAHEMFQTAQWALNSEAGAALAQVAARAATGDPRLAAMVREQQDLLAERQKLDDARFSGGWGLEEGRRFSAIGVRIAEVGKQLEAEFPDYAALSRRDSSSIEQVQAELAPDEALILLLDTPQWNPTPEETFIWVVTKTDMRWERSDLGTKALSREVQALRCGLDDAAWDDQPCAELAGQNYTYKDRNDGKAPPFDLARAHKLYEALFGQVEDLIKGKSLLIVPSGPLTQLPFQVLLTAAPQSGDHRSAPWLIREHALTVLPAVSSLKALRRVARPSAATRAMIGFGNPLLDGDQSDKQLGAYFKKRAQLARDKQRCPETPWQRFAALVGIRRGVAQVQTRGGLADADFLRMQAPLPETADELCAVARDVNADLAEIRLGARATEREVKRLSETGELARYRIVHFATHGALAGQVTGNAEPGLLLTPPESPSEGDDGYLTASEIAGLKLDADWVILSACNTAAGGAKGAEALSGLARAFIYAQARALLVSHWEVNSDATVKLITGAIRRLAADKAMGRAEAMRQSMLALIDGGAHEETHPAFWAPFVLVGEGGAGR